MHISVSWHAIFEAVLVLCSVNMPPCSLLVHVIPRPSGKLGAGSSKPSTIADLFKAKDMPRHDTSAKQTDVIGAKKE